MKCLLPRIKKAGKYTGCHEFMIFNMSVCFIFQIILCQFTAQPIHMEESYAYFSQLQNTVRIFLRVNEVL